MIVGLIPKTWLVITRVEQHWNVLLRCIWTCLLGGDPIVRVEEMNVSTMLNAKTSWLLQDRWGRHRRRDTTIDLLTDGTEAEEFRQKSWGHDGWWYWLRLIDCYWLIAIAAVLWALHHSSEAVASNDTTPISNVGSHVMFEHVWTTRESLRHCPHAGEKNRLSYFRTPLIM